MSRNVLSQYFKEFECFKKGLKESPFKEPHDEISIIQVGYSILEFQCPGYKGSLLVLCMLPTKWVGYLPDLKKFNNY
jgi:hypothetical protein